MAVRSPFFTRTPHAASLPRRGARSCTLLFVYEILSNNAFTASAFLCESGDKITAFELSRQIFQGLFFEFFRGKEVNGLISEGKGGKFFSGEREERKGKEHRQRRKSGNIKNELPLRQQTISILQILIPSFSYYYKDVQDLLRQP
jgi:hypothetical protein